ncbi:unnamed protein product [Penicillium olsonii]|uniref:AB hydrolase-1 domain-containing protein n=1 Tax=Penicillium olsonii TaxID=99116 RepID=A0A9W4IDG2_PENOL|nr:unnamed protein product [Penicillium olsonii]CAG8248194.1 unnamed protein product [Penicillium olsonii]CAG8260754.1 unnamed protein product [Penicillium olsonii]
MNPKDNTIVVFAPGAWSAGSAYDEFRELLTRRGIASFAMDHLTNGAEPPNKRLSDDQERLRRIVSTYADEGKQIVLVGHSYGGMVITAASSGLGLEERAKAGQPGGIKVLVFMAAFVTPKGKCLKDMIGGQLWPWMLVDGDYVRLDPNVDLVQDVPEETKAKKAKHALPHICLRAFLDRATEEPWHTIPSAYIACDEDIALPAAIQDNMIELLPNPRVFRLPSGHSPFLSLPNETADILELLCK